MAISSTLVSTLAACGTVGGNPTPTASAPAAGRPPSAQALPLSPVASPLPEPGSSPAADAQAVVVQAALRDAASRLSLASAAGDLQVQRVEARNWPDSSLGCPREGIMYAQVVTPGFLIVVSGAGRELEYHADARGRLELCQAA